MAGLDLEEVKLNPSCGSFDVDRCIERLKNKELLAEAAVKEMCEKVKELLMRESNVVHLSAPVTVVGDIHGSAIIRHEAGSLRLMQLVFGAQTVLRLA